MLIIKHTCVPLAVEWTESVIIHLKAKMTKGSVLFCDAFNNAVWGGSNY